MNQPVKEAEQPRVEKLSAEPQSDSKSGFRLPPRISWWLVALAGLTLVFSRQLFALAQYGWAETLYSHIFLVPLITGYLIWIQRHKQWPAFTSSWMGGGIMALAGLGLMIWHGLLVGRGLEPGSNDSLAMTTASFWSLSLAVTLFALGWPIVKFFLFPTLFLLFAIPMPTAMTAGIEIFFQHTSAVASEWLIAGTGTPVFRDGLNINVPGVWVRVAQECSGIRSSLVLFMTSLLGGYIFLRSQWSRAAVALFVIPLGIARNGFRIMTLAVLASNWDPEILKSALHHRGGPIFFALSLIPFFLFLLIVKKLDKRWGESTKFEERNPKEVLNSKAGKY